MGENLGLNNHHHQQAINFIRFSRYKRLQSLKGVEQCFHDLEDSKLYDDTYTIDEVKEMINELMKSVHNEMDMELLNSSHTSTLLLAQLLTQAEKWHLKLNCDVSELENRELLEQIAAFEEKEMSISAGTGDSKLKLNPINQTGGAELLNNEIERLKAENRNLLTVVKKQEQAVSDSGKLNKSLMTQINDLNLATKSKGDSAVRDLEKQVAELQVDLQSKSKDSTMGDGELMSDLTSTKHELLRTRKELETASEELNLKFQQTSAYKNLKDMLTKKNEQIKILRKNLQQYEGDE